MIVVILLVITFLFVSPTHVQAYLDPGTGSYITQIAIGFLVGGAYVAKVYWQQLISFIRKLFPGKKKDHEEPKDQT